MVPDQSPDTDTRQVATIRNCPKMPFADAYVRRSLPRGQEGALVVGGSPIKVSVHALAPRGFGADTQDECAISTLEERDSKGKKMRLIARNHGVLQDSPAAKHTEDFQHFVVGD